jgi:hypothetical protein
MRVPTVPIASLSVRAPVARSFVAAHCLRSDSRVAMPMSPMLALSTHNKQVSSNAICVSPLLCALPVDCVSLSPIVESTVTRTCAHPSVVSPTRSYASPKIALSASNSSICSSFIAALHFTAAHRAVPASARVSSASRRRSDSSAAASEIAALVPAAPNCTASAETAAACRTRGQCGGSGES